MFNFFGRFSKRKDQYNAENGGTNPSKEKSKEQPPKSSDTQRKSLTHSPKFFNKTKDKNKLDVNAKQESSPPVESGVSTQKEMFEYENRAAATDAGNEIPDADATLSYLGSVPYEAISNVQRTSSDDTKSNDSVNSAIRDLIAPMGWKSRAKAKGKAAQKKATPGEHNAQVKHSVNAFQNTCDKSQSLTNVSTDKSDICAANTSEPNIESTKSSRANEQLMVRDNKVNSFSKSGKHNVNQNPQSNKNLNKIKSVKNEVNTVVEEQKQCNDSLKNNTILESINSATPINGIVHNKDRMGLLNTKQLDTDQSTHVLEKLTNGEENTSTDKCFVSKPLQTSVSENVLNESTPVKPPRHKNITESTEFQTTNNTIATEAASTKQPREEKNTESISVIKSQTQDVKSEDTSPSCANDVQRTEPTNETNSSSINGAATVEANSNGDEQKIQDVNADETKQTTLTTIENACADTLKNADATDKTCCDVTNEVIVALNSDEISDKLELSVGEAPNSPTKNIGCFEKDAINCATNGSAADAESNSKLIESIASTNIPSVSSTDQTNGEDTPVNEGLLIANLDLSITKYDDQTIVKINKPEVTPTTPQTIILAETPIASKVLITDRDTSETKTDAAILKTTSSDETLNDNGIDQENATVCREEDTSTQQKESVENETKNLVNQETRFQEQITDLTQKLTNRETDTCKMQYEMQDLHRELFAKTSGMDRLQAELTAAHKETEYVRHKLRHLESEVTSFKQKNRDLEEEISKKSDEVNSMKTINTQKAAELEATINELTNRIERLDVQLKTIKEERDKFEEKCKALEKEREEERNIVQQALEEAIKEKKVIQQQWEKDFEKLRTVNTGREQQLLDDFEWKLREVEQTCKRRLEEKDKKVDEIVKEAHRAVEEKVKRAEEQLNEVLHLKSYEAEVSQLRGLTHDQQRSLRLMSQRTEQLQLEEDTLKAEIIRLKSLIDNEKNNLIKLQNAHAKELEEKDRLMHIHLDQQKSEVAVQWEDRLRHECSRLKMELDQLHNEEKQLAIESYKLQKEQEFSTAKENWEKQHQENIKEIAALKELISKKEEQYQKKMEKLQTNADRDLLELRRTIDKIDNSYTNQIEKLTDKYEKKIGDLTEESEKRLKDSETNWQMQLSSTRTTLELVKEQMERDAQTKLLALDQHHRSQLEHQWEQLVQDKEEALQAMEHKYRTNCDKLKEELINLQKSYAAKESEHTNKIDDLKNELTLKEYLMNDIQNNVDTLQGGIQVLNQEILHQNREITKVQDTAAKKIREMKENLKEEHIRELAEQKRKFLSQLQQIEEKSKLHFEDIQKKHHMLAKMYEEIRLKYEKRESKPEDLNLIRDLRQIIAEQEKDITSLTEEKRFYQLEVMNKRGIPNQDIQKNDKFDNQMSSGCSQSSHSPSPEFEIASNVVDTHECSLSCNKAHLKLSNSSPMLPHKYILESIEEVPYDEDNTPNRCTENSVDT